MIGCSFVVNRKFFGEIGLLDPGMDVYGGENIELGIKSEMGADWAEQLQMESFQLTRAGLAFATAFHTR
ncbi:hypothetical protein H8959_007547 [Pygathrix nigripes]